ncbi:MAG: sigma factor-like helix-turn-helix DNA-binding protein, partial [Cellulosilyticaceae bacterium]
MSTLRKNKSRVQLAVPEQSAWDEEHIDWATTLSLHASVEQLDIKLKTVIILRYFEDMKIEEIAYIVNSPKSTVKSRIRKGLGELERLLGENS